jgi:divinyl chlorophyllide a 8-vinyl-reductase
VGSKQLSVAVFGASGTVGRACVRQLVRDGYRVTATYRDPGRITGDTGIGEVICDLSDREGIASKVFGDTTCDVVVSCVASRTGVEDDAWLVDYQANRNILAAARSAGVRHMILISAICVQKPRLAFQHAKLAFEEDLRNSGLTYSIVRPTAFFKSLSGQVERVRRGKPFVVFGDGTLTRCKPISDADLASYVSGCITDPGRHDRILEIGGPGPAITPRDQGEKLFELVGKQPRFRHVPVAVLDVAIAVMGTLARLSRRFGETAEYARIGRYYATESMLVLDSASGSYSDRATPETGSQTLFDHYADLLGKRGRPGT